MRTSLRFGVILLAAIPACQDGGVSGSEGPSASGTPTSAETMMVASSSTPSSAATSNGSVAPPVEGPGGSCGSASDPVEPSDEPPAGAAGEAPTSEASGGTRGVPQSDDAGAPSAPGGAGAVGGAAGDPNSGGGGSAGSGEMTPDAGPPTSGTPAEMALPDLPAVRQEHSVVALDGEVYVIAGYAPNVSDSVLAYDPETEAWRDSTPFPDAMNHGNAGVVNGRIHVAGYYVGGMTQATGNHYAFDPDTEEWTTVSPLPVGTERAASCVATDGNLLYVIGGANGGASVELASRYDAGTDAWEVLPPLPERREHCAAGAIDGIVYVAGGRADGISGVEPTTWALDPEQMQWSERAGLSPARGGLGGAVLGGRLFVFGGEGNSEVESGVFPDVDAYDPVLDAWEKLPPMNVPRHGFGAATMGGRIYLAGGATRQGGGADDQSSVFYFE